MERRTKRRIALVVDSTAYMPQHLLDQHRIHVVPVTLTMGDRSWRDGVDIDPPAFYEILKTGKDFPTTSQPSVGVFEELFVTLAEDHEGILVITVTSDLSGTYSSAMTAKANLPNIPIEIIDSRGVSMQIGFPAVAAANVADAGGDLKAVADAARALVGRTHLYFVVGTLEYLKRGGRIGKAAWLLGSALDLKPILALKDGVIFPAAKVRTRRKALDMLFQMIGEQIPAGSKVHMSVINIAAPEEAAELKRQLQARFSPVEMVEAECSPAIGAHGGPGTVGAAFFVE